MLGDALSSDNSPDKSKPSLNSIDVVSGINASLRSKLKFNLVPGMQGSVNRKVNIEDQDQLVRPGIIARRRRERSMANKNDSGQLKVSELRLGSRLTFDASRELSGVNYEYEIEKTLGNVNHIQ